MNLFGSSAPLQTVYDAAMLDLDGVVYVSGEPIAYAPEAIAQARQAGLHLGFVTNNASRTTESVATNLTSMGIPTKASDVVSSPQAATRMVQEAYGAGASVIALGGKGLHAALAEGGMSVVPVDARDAEAVVTGYGPDVKWRDVMQVAVRIREGLPWIATNTDASIPTAFGIAPGHGVMVDMLRAFSGVAPRVAGKPAPPLLEETIRRLGAHRPLMVGDRLDTDIEGAHAVGVDSLLVFTGVSTWRDVCVAPAHQRPTYVADDLRGLNAHHEGVRCDGLIAHGAGWRAGVESGVMVVQGSGARSDWLRTVVAASWLYADATGQVPSFDGVAPPLVGADD